MHIYIYKSQPINNFRLKKQLCNAITVAQSVSAHMNRALGLTFSELMPCWITSIQPEASKNGYLTFFHSDLLNKTLFSSTNSQKLSGLLVTVKKKKIKKKDSLWTQFAVNNASIFTNSGRPDGSTMCWLVDDINWWSLAYFILTVHIKLCQNIISIVYGQSLILEDLMDGYVLLAHDTDTGEVSHTSY